MKKKVLKIKTSKQVKQNSTPLTPCQIIIF
jgi:hypothetical protein